MAKSIEFICILKNFNINFKRTICLRKDGLYLSKTTKNKPVVNVTLWYLIYILVKSLDFIRNLFLFFKKHGKDLL